MSPMALDAPDLLGDPSPQGRAFAALEGLDYASSRRGWGGGMSVNEVVGSIFFIALFYLAVAVR